MTVATSASRNTHASLDRQLLFFPRGILGFETTTQFQFERNTTWAPFGRLSAVHDPGLSFVVAPPRVFVPEYTIVIESEEIGDLEVRTASELDLWAVVTEVDDTAAFTLNLQGPILINHTNGRAKQVVLTRTSYSTSHPIGSMS